MFWLLAVVAGVELNLPPPEEAQRECLETCGLNPKFCLASNASTAVDLILEGRAINLNQQAQHYAAAWLASFYDTTPLFEMLVAKFDTEMVHDGASIIHGAMWQTMYKEGAERRPEPAEMLALGLRLCGTGSLEMQWTCSHGIGHGAYWYAAALAGTVGPEAPCKRHTKVKDTTATVKHAEKVCDAYENRGLAYACAEGVWMVFFFITFPAPDVTHCLDVAYPAFCVFYAPYARGEHRKVPCDLKPTDVCKPFWGTTQRLEHHCAWGVGAIEGFSYWGEERCGRAWTDQYKVCEDFGSNATSPQNAIALTETCLQGLALSYMIVIGEASAIRDGTSYCKAHCQQWERSHDPNVRNSPCWDLAVCQEKSKWTSWTDLFPVTVLDSTY